VAKNVAARTVTLDEALPAGWPTGGTSALLRGLAGLNIGYGCKLVAVYDDDADDVMHTTAHEIGHSFGWEDIAETANLMFWSAGYNGEHLRYRKLPAKTGSPSYGQWDVVTR